MKNINVKKFTFRTEKPTGRYRSFQKPIHYIKLNKIEVGFIDHHTPHKIRLKVIKDDIMEDGNPNCVWKWIVLKNDFESVDEAKKFLNDNFSSIRNGHRIYEMK